MDKIKKILPQDSKLTREQIYQGEVLCFPAIDVSKQLVSDVLTLLKEELGEDVRTAQFRFSDEEFFEHIGKLRKIIYTQTHFHDLAKELLLALNFIPNENAFEPIRLRVITHKGHENPKAAPIYYAHRDTWYAHSQALITWWIPLHDLREEETFVFFPEYFNCPVKNGSEHFDYDQWMLDKRQLTVGWQDKNAGSEAFYPSLMEEIDTNQKVGFSVQSSEIILFSGSCLHQTLNNLSGLTRFSLDFRTVDLKDHKENIGAPNIDNFSRGSAMKQYIYPSN
ncbi:MAG: hypothetical protein WAQ98_31085 [Blastocatellia bacterium]